MSCSFFACRRKCESLSLTLCNGLTIFRLKLLEIQVAILVLSLVVCRQLLLHPTWSTFHFIQPQPFWKLGLHPLKFLVGCEPRSSVVSSSQGEDLVAPQVLGAVWKHSSPGCNYFSFCSSLAPQEMSDIIQGIARGKESRLRHRHPSSLDKF